MRVWVVLTSHDQLGHTGKKTGFWLEEFAAPYYVFRDAGAEIVLASPHGGQPPLDPKSDEAEAQTEATRRFKQDPIAQAALSHAARLCDVKTLRRQPRRRVPQWRKFGALDIRFAHTPVNIAL